MSIEEMNLKRIKEYKEPWKKKEPKSRLSSKAQEAEWHFQKQREKMEKELGKNPQSVRIECHASILLPSGMFKSFTVKVRYPLSQHEFNERIRAAFPELKWEEP